MAIMNTRLYQDDEEIEKVEEDENFVDNKVFDPRKVDISIEQQNIDFLLQKIEYNMEDLELENELEEGLIGSYSGVIDLNTEFQRSKDLWTDVAMSRLIESVLIRFPLPAFYFDTTNRKKWQVVDGLQRLSTFRKFIIDDELKLKGLEFLDKEKYEGKKFSQLPIGLQRAIKGTQVVLYLIRPGTPKEVKYRLFERINTGGLKLNYQEIRHAINQGIPANYVKKMAELHSFTKIVKISARRMQDREACLRFLAFRFMKYTSYQEPMYGFLNEAMEKIADKDKKELEQIFTEFDLAMKTSYKLFGKKGFSRNIFDSEVNNKKVRYPINKALFEAWTTSLSLLNEDEQVDLVNKKEILLEKYKKAIYVKGSGTNTKPLVKAVTASTTNNSAVKTRFEIIENMISETLNK